LDFFDSQAQHKQQPAVNIKQNKMKKLTLITGFQFLNLFRIVGGIEVAIALACIFSKRTWLPTGLLAWLATSFLAYRIGLVAVGYHRPCSCMGNLTDALHIPPQTADTAMKIILAYLLIGGAWKNCGCCWILAKAAARSGVVKLMNGWLLDANPAVANFPRAMMIDV
jgi:hypothetical protein